MSAPPAAGPRMHDNWKVLLFQAIARERIGRGTNPVMNAELAGRKNVSAEAEMKRHA